MLLCKLQTSCYFKFQPGISLHPKNSVENTDESRRNAFSKLAKALEQFLAENRVVEPF